METAPLDLTDINEPDAIVQAAHQGYPRAYAFTFTRQYHFPLEELAPILGVTERTLRNYQQQENQLSPHQSEMLVKLGQLLKRGEEVFGSDRAFRSWMKEPVIGLDWVSAQTLLVTSEGINLVRDEVERIANGEFA